MAQRRLSFLLALAATAAATLACRPAGGPADLQSGGVGAGDNPADFSPLDLEGTWRGWSEPLNPFDQRLELTLGFDAWGAASNAAGLTEYSFPSPVNGERVDYLELLDEYELNFTPSGRLGLDTVFRSHQWFGVDLEEFVYKDLRMNEARDRLEGGETIEVYENGRLTILYEGWLTLHRVD
jgi:hypothetical protein